MGVSESWDPVTRPICQVRPAVYPTAGRRRHSPLAHLQADRGRQGAITAAIPHYTAGEAAACCSFHLWCARQTPSKPSWANAWGPWIVRLGKTMLTVETQQLTDPRPHFTVSRRPRRPSSLSPCPCVTAATWGAKPSLLRAVLRLASGSTAAPAAVCGGPCRRAVLVAPWRAKVADRTVRGHTPRRRKKVTWEPIITAGPWRLQTSIEQGA